MATTEIAGSGELRITTPADVRRAVELHAERQALVQRTSLVDDEDLTGLLVSDFWASLGATSGVHVSPQLIQNCWVAARCLQMNSQQIASMPLRFFGSQEPAWVSNPDPNWYPNGIGDAVFALVWSMYAWGDGFALVTDRYANSSFPRTWTVLDPAPMDVTVRSGRKRFKSGNVELNPEDVIQISRDPGGVRGTSALSAYGTYLYGLLATAEMARQMSGESGVPNTVLRPKRKLNPEQAEALQAQWAARTSARRGAPAILPPDIEFDQLAFSPADLMLLDVQKFDAQVIASAFGIPPYMINLPIEGGLTYQTPVLAGEHWWRFELLPAAARVQRALSANMLPRGSWVEFDARSTLAPTFTELTAAWVGLHAAGIVTTDEVRAAILNLPPEEEGEALADLLTPPTASASPAQQQSASVVALRPTGVRQ